MIRYDCTKCGWKGDSEQVMTLQTHEFMGVVEESISEEDNEFLNVCPICRPYQLAYDNK